MVEVMSGAFERLGCALWWCMGYGLLRIYIAEPIKYVIRIRYHILNFAVVEFGGTLHKTAGFFKRYLAAIENLIYKHENKY